jgi:hypothetical protein
MTLCAALAGVLAACAAGPRLQVAGDPPPPSVALSQEGIRVTLVPGAWDAVPSWLPGRYHPIQALIENGRPEEVVVRLADFVAIDQTGTQYRAVPPAEVAQALFGALGGRRPSPSAAAEAPLYASAWWPYRARRHWPYYHGPFFGPYYPYGPYSPWHDPWWGYPYGGPRDTPEDIFRLGLREGRVLPGARVEGFLYLQPLRPEARTLTLLWTPVLGEGRPVPFRAEFTVVR